MKIRFPARQDRWRHRFLEIARQVSGGSASAGLAVAGLRPRPQSGPFAATRRRAQ